jgi:hypothetical protein
VSKKKVTLVVRCTFEINAKSYDTAVLKALNIIYDSLESGEDEPLKDYQIDAVTAMMEREI